MYAARMNPFAPLPTRSRGNAQQELHTLSIAASVTRVKWRPMSSNSAQNSESLDLHEPMLAVATSSIKGASAGGAGQVSLWSWSRPFMPVCILEGHTEGAVPDFDWIDTPAPESIRKDLFSGSEGGEMVGSKIDATNLREHPKGDFLHHDPSVQVVDQGLKVWQHILSIGRDGRCLVQSFVRGKTCITSLRILGFLNSCLTWLSFFMIVHHNRGKTHIASSAFLFFNGKFVAFSRRLRIASDFLHLSASPIRAKG